MATDVGNAVGPAAGSAGGAAIACPALGAIATAAGAFSRLFGAGGGTIIVPLLVLWLGYEQKEATGTSLAATLANAVSERGLELSFAAVQLMFAWQLAKKAGLR
jgi:uncharacterized membrane protein YfcA